MELQGVYMVGVMAHSCSMMRLVAREPLQVHLRFYPPHACTFLQTGEMSCEDRFLSR
jgi:hypothetical protein